MAENEEVKLPAISIQIKPRIQKDKWSLYWKVNLLTVKYIKFEGFPISGK